MLWFWANLFSEHTTCVFQRITCIYNVNVHCQTKKSTNACQRERKYIRNCTYEWIKSEINNPFACLAELLYHRKNFNTSSLLAFRHFCTEYTVLVFGFFISITFDTWYFRERVSLYSSDVIASVSLVFDIHVHIEFEVFYFFLLGCHTLVHFVRRELNLRYRILLEKYRMCSSNIYICTHTSQEFMIEKMSRKNKITKVDERRFRTTFVA